jgi:hypothetical protein
MRNTNGFASPTEVRERVRCHELGHTLEPSTAILHKLFVYGGPLDLSSRLHVAARWIDWKKGREWSTARRGIETSNLPTELRRRLLDMVDSLPDEKPKWGPGRYGGFMQRISMLKANAEFLNLLRDLHTSLWTASAAEKDAAILVAVQRNPSGLGVSRLSEYLALSDPLNYPVINQQSRDRIQDLIVVRIFKSPVWTYMSCLDAARRYRQRLEQYAGLDELNFLVLDYLITDRRIRLPDTNWLAQQLGETDDVMTLTRPPLQDPRQRTETSETAVEYVRQLLEDKYPDAQIQKMHPNNPGYDIRVLTGNGEQFYIEVKGTRLDTPRFFLTENERRFGEGKGDNYFLYTVTNVAGELAHREIRDPFGANMHLIELTPFSYQGRVTC